MADTLIDDFDVIEVTQVLVERCVDLFDAAAGLLLADPDGTLRVFASSTEQLRIVELFEVQAQADATAISILQQRALQEARLLAEQLRAALDSRVLIEQAKGMLAERAQLSVTDAFVAIRRYARDHNERITGVSRAIIDGTLGVGDLL